MEDTCDQCDKWPTDKPVLIEGGILCVECAGKRIAALDHDNTLKMRRLAALEEQIKQVYLVATEAILRIRKMQNIFGPLPGGEP